MGGSVSMILHSFGSRFIFSGPKVKYLPFLALAPSHPDVLHILPRPNHPILHGIPDKERGSRSTGRCMQGALEGGVLEKEAQGEFAEGAEGEGDWAQEKEYAEGIKGVGEGEVM